MDDHPFIRYDSRVGRAEPQAGWMVPMEAQYWETETRKQRAWAEVQQVETWTVMGYRNHTGGAWARPHRRPFPPPSFTLCTLSFPSCPLGDSGCWARS